MNVERACSAMFGNPIRRIYEIYEIWTFSAEYEYSNETIINCVCAMECAIGWLCSFGKRKSNRNANCHWMSFHSNHLRIIIIYCVWNFVCIRNMLYIWLIGRYFMGIMNQNTNGILSKFRWKRIIKQLLKTKSAISFHLRLFIWNSHFNCTGGKIKYECDAIYIRNTNKDLNNMEWNIFWECFFSSFAPRDMWQQKKVYCWHMCCWFFAKNI